MTVQNITALQEALINAKDMDEMIKVFADQGIDVTAEELEQAAKAALAEDSGELTESDLEDVAGGYGNFIKTASDYVGRAALKAVNSFLGYIGSYIK